MKYIIETFNIQRKEAPNRKRRNFVRSTKIQFFINKFSHSYEEKEKSNWRKGEENTALPHPESPETNRDVTTTAAATVIAELLTHRHHYNHHTAGYFTFTAITHLHNGEKPGESSSNGISRLARGSKQNTTRNRHSHQSRERTIRQMMTFTWT